MGRWGGGTVARCGGGDVGGLYNPSNFAASGNSIDILKCFIVTLPIYLLSVSKIPGFNPGISRRKEEIEGYVSYN